MEARSPKDKEKEEKFVLQSTIAAMQMRFSAVVNQNAQITKFYTSHVQSLLDNFNQFKSLADIDEAFRRLCGTTSTLDGQLSPTSPSLFVIEAKALDSNIRQGYLRVLELFRFYFMYEFIQARLVHGIATGSAIPPAEADELKELQVVQDANVQHGLQLYLIQLAVWRQQSFAVLPDTLQERSTFLNAEIGRMNQAMKEEAATRDEKADLDSQSALCAAETNFAASYRSTAAMLAAQQRLADDCKQFALTLAEACQAIDMKDLKHCAAIVDIVPVVVFSSEEISRTHEYKQAMAVHEAKKSSTEEKKYAAGTRLTAIARIEGPFLKFQQSLPIPSRIGISVQHKISVCLNEFSGAFKRLLVGYRSQISQHQQSESAALTEVTCAAEEAKKQFLSSCRQQTAEKLSAEIKSLNTQAVQARAQQRAEHVQTLQPHCSLLPMDTVPASISTRLESKEQQLNAAWKLMGAGAVEPYQQRFEKANTAKAETLDSKEIKQKLEVLRVLSQESEFQRCNILLSLKNGWVKGRKKLIRRMINENFMSFFNRLEQAKRELKLALVLHYKRRFEAIRDNFEARAKKVAGVRQILHEIEGEDSIVLERVQLVEKMGIFLHDELVGDQKMRPSLAYQKPLAMNNSAEPSPVQRYQSARKLRLNTRHNQAVPQPVILPEYNTRWAIFWAVAVPLMIFGIAILLSWAGFTASLGWYLVLASSPLVNFYAYGKYHERQCRLALEAQAREKETSAFVVAVAMDSSSSPHSSDRVVHSALPHRKPKRPQNANAFLERSITYNLIETGQLRTQREQPPAKKEVLGKHGPITKSCSSQV